MRKIILHHHFFKNAGSTVISALVRELGEGFVEHHPSGESRGKFTAADLGTLLNANPQLQAVSSHHLTGMDYNRDPLLKDRFQFIDIILVRHPLKRLMSIYNYYQTLERNSHPLIGIAQSRPVTDFFNFLIQEQPNRVMSPQVKFLSGCANTHPSSKDVNLAIDRILGCAACGTVDSFFEAMVTAEFNMMPFFPHVKLHYSIVNVSPAASGYDGSLESIERLIGHDLYRKLADLNALDIELCKAVEYEVKRRKQSIPGYSRVAENFSKRCADLNMHANQAA